MGINRVPAGPRPPLPGEQPLFRFNLDGEAARIADFTRGWKAGSRAGLVVGVLVGFVLGMVSLGAVVWFAQ